MSIEVNLPDNYFAYTVVVADKPVTVKALSPGVEVRGRGLAEGESVTVDVSTAVGGHGRIRVGAETIKEKKVEPKKAEAKRGPRSGGKK